ncbi:DUF6323 family protein [Clostridium sp. MB05]
MNKNISLALQDIQKKQAIIELKSCNEITSKYGLTLSNEDINELVENRFKSLKDTGRIEFSEGVLKKLVEAFCDSPYIMQQNYKDTLMEIQESFYFFKSEAMDQIPDDELIEFMKRHFDGKCQGSVEYLSGTSLEELCRNTRYGYEVDDTDIYGHEF